MDPTIRNKLKERVLEASSAPEFGLHKILIDSFVR
jgi:hypothetical protein